MQISAAITINGPKGIYSFDFFTLNTINIIPIIAPNKNDVKDIKAVFTNPKYKPSAAMNFTSPKPIASFPYINLPINVIIKKIPPPINIPNNISIVIATFENPYRNAITSPT